MNIHDDAGLREAPSPSLSCLDRCAGPLDLETQQGECSELTVNEDGNFQEAFLILILSLSPSCLYQGVFNPCDLVKGHHYQWLWATHGLLILLHLVFSSGV